MEQQDLLPELIIDGDAAYHIKGMASWAKFLSIIGFIACGFIVIAAIFAGSLIASMSGRYGDAYGTSVGTGMGAMLTIVYLVMAIVYFIPTLFLFQSASKLKSAIGLSDQGLLNEGLAKLRSVFKFWGILTIIIISIYLLVIVFAILGAAVN